MSFLDIFYDLDLQYPHEHSPGQPTLVSMLGQRLDQMDPEDTANFSVQSMNVQII